MILIINELQRCVFLALKTVLPTHEKYPFRMLETRFSLRHYDIN